MDAYEAVEKEQYMFIKLGDKIFNRDSDLPASFEVEDDFKKIKDKHLVLDTNALERFTSTILNYVSTARLFVLYKPKPVHIIDKRYDAEHESRLEKHLKDSGLRQFTNFYSTLDDFKRNYLK